MNCESDKQILISLKKAKTHISQIIEMVERGDYCIDVIQQLNAISGYIDSARNRKLKSHLETCFSEGMMTKSGSKKTMLINELLQALNMSK